MMTIAGRAAPKPFNGARVRHGPAASGATPDPGRTVELSTVSIDESEIAFAITRATDAYDLNGRRTRVLGADLFTDPAWEIMLDLFINTGTGRPLSVSAVCIGSRGSITTALRYIGLLAAAGLLSRVADECDARRSYVRLTELGRARMLDLLLARTA